MANIIIGKVAPVFRGEYNNTLTYERLDIVSYNGSSYACLKQTQGVLPTNNSFWVLVAIKGEKGDNTTIQQITDVSTGKSLESIIKTLSLNISTNESNITNLGNKIKLTEKIYAFDNTGKGGLRYRSNGEYSEGGGGGLNYIYKVDKYREVLLNYSFTNITMNQGWCLYWFVDSTGTPIGHKLLENITVTDELVELPSNTSELWVYSDRVEVKGVLLENINEVVNNHTEEINELKPLNKYCYAKRIIEAEETKTGALSTNGSINTTLGKYRIYKLSEKVSKIYATFWIGNTPNIGWCDYWITDKNGKMLFPKQTVGNRDEIPFYHEDELIDYTPFVENGAYYLFLQYASSYGEPVIYCYDKTFSDLSDEFESLDEIVKVKEELDEIRNSIDGNLNHWKGKKIVWMGTSLPAGQSADDGGYVKNTYPKLVGEKLQCTVINNSVAGLGVEAIYENGKWKPRTTMGSASLTVAEYAADGSVTSIGNRSFENNMLGKNADLYVFDIEPNNSNDSTDDLDNFSVMNWKYKDGSDFASHRNTFAGATIFLLDKLFNEKPNAKVVFVGEYVGLSNDEKYETYNIQEVFKKIAKKFKIPYIDVSSKLYYNPINYRQYINSDKLHANQAGHERIANILTNELLLIG